MTGLGIDLGCDICKTKILQSICQPNHFLAAIGRRIFVTTDDVNGERLWHFSQHLRLWASENQTKKINPERNGSIETAERIGDVFLHFFIDMGKPVEIGFGILDACRGTKLVETIMVCIR